MTCFLFIGTERWGDETPRWRKEEIGEWGQDRGGGRGEDSQNRYIIYTVLYKVSSVKFFLEVNYIDLPSILTL